MTLGEKIARLAMDEPPSEETRRETADCIDALDGLATDADGERRALFDALRALLAAARAREVLYVFAVPHATAAAELLSPASGVGVVALRGARFELESLLPMPGKGPAAPDVPLSALSRGAKPDTPD